MMSSLCMGCFGGDSDDGFEWPDPISDGCHVDYDLECSTLLQLGEAAHHSLINPLDGKMWIVFLGGMIKSWDGENLEDVADLSDLVSRCHMEQGLLGISFDSDYVESKIVLLSYVEDGTCEGENQSDLVLSSAKIGDAAIIKEIIKILSQNKIKTENSLIFNPNLSLKKGNYSKIKPSKQDQLDIKKGIKILGNLRQYDFSQGVVVRNKKIVAIEGKGGTKKMLEKSRSKKFRNQGVLVKFPKKKQDLRVDLPTIGLKTLKQCKAAGLKGIVVKSKQHIFLDKYECINLANKNKMFITVK